jgi:type III restriction enzyme
MIQLKAYQERVLASLRTFFQHCAQHGQPAQAFEQVQVRNGIYPPVLYVPVMATGLQNGMPYVCLRVPTGGGKTLLACHAVGLAMHQLLRSERSVVLWLVPSNTILDQTAAALRDPRHPYRRALELGCGAVEVMTIAEALRLSRAAVDGQTVIIVATIQSFRVEDTTGRKVYEQNGAFAEHLHNLPAQQLQALLPGVDGNPVPSLVNMLRLRRPIVIVDEAHNARTDLSFATLGAVLPACIIEFTATPARSKHPSNVLHQVSAAELKAAEMVKLPLRVINRHPSQRDQLLAEAITLRADLEQLATLEAQQTGEYLRPIMLIQAERVDHCEPLRERMVNEYGLRQEAIKISVGKLDELKEIKEITAPTCPVRFIITVEKLREGWDCPFAYVLCSLKESRSATAIEQIVGRILRLPRARAKVHPDLNCAYAFSVSDSLASVLGELREALENNGFTKAEAERIILPVAQGALPLGNNPQTVQVEPTIDLDIPVAHYQAEMLGGKVQIDAVKGEITVLVPLSEEEQEALNSCLKTPAAKAKVQAAVALVQTLEKAFGGSGKPRPLTPHQQQLDFVVPLLCVQENGTLFEFESTFLIEHPWRLSTKDASLPSSYHPLQRPAAQSGVLDVGATGKVETQIAERFQQDDFIAQLHQQTFALTGATDWSVEQLIAWLDRKIDHTDIPISEAAAFLRKVIRGLMTTYGITDPTLLALDRFRLRDQIAQRIQEHRLAEQKQTFQLFLNDPLALTVSDAYTINFSHSAYEPSWLYEGAYPFKKHYYGPKPGELRELTSTGEQTEECRCALFLEALPEVKYWVRNLARKRSSFRLQTATDWFYPDFVCQLTDGRILVVEYKGKHIFDGNDASEKRAVGAVWEARSNGRCLFVMPTGNDFSEIRRHL